MHMVSSLTVHRAFLAAVLAAFVPSCIDLKPKEAPVVRWLSVAVADEAQGPELTPPVEPLLRLERVIASDAITRQLMTRTSAFEVTYADLSRWAEPPVQAVQRALEEELYRRRGFERATGSAPRSLHRAPAPPPYWFKLVI